jgi:hypothetical protein
VAPRDLALSRPSPRGKKNSRGAPRLRQIERANSALTQVRHAVMGRSHGVVPLASRARPAMKPKFPADKTRHSAHIMARAPFSANADRGGETGVSPR